MQRAASQRNLQQAAGLPPERRRNAVRDLLQQQAAQAEEAQVPQSLAGRQNVVTRRAEEALGVRPHRHRRHEREAAQGDPLHQRQDEQRQAIETKKEALAVDRKVWAIIHYHKLQDDPKVWIRLDTPLHDNLNRLLGLEKTHTYTDNSL